MVIGDDRRMVMGAKSLNCAAQATGWREARAVGIRGDIPDEGFACDPLNPGGGSPVPLKIGIRTEAESAPLRGQPSTELVETLPGEVVEVGRAAGGNHEQRHSGTLDDRPVAVRPVRVGGSQRE